MALTVHENLCMNVDSFDIQSIIYYDFLIYMEVVFTEFSNKIF